MILEIAWTGGKFDFMKMFKRIIKETYSIVFFSIMTLFFIYDLITVRHLKLMEYKFLDWVSYILVVLTLISYFYLLRIYRKEEKDSYAEG